MGMPLPVSISDTELIFRLFEFNILCPFRLFSEIMLVLDVADRQQLIEKAKQ